PYRLFNLPFRPQQRIGCRWRCAKVADRDNPPDSCGARRRDQVARPDKFNPLKIALPPPPLRVCEVDDNMRAGHRAKQRLLVEDTAGDDFRRGLPWQILRLSGSEQAAHMITPCHQAANQMPANKACCACYEYQSSLREHRIIA